MFSVRAWLFYAEPRHHECGFKGVFMSNDRFDKQIQFIIEIDRLKQVYRQTYLTDGSRFENSVEHSWHLAMMVLVLSEYKNYENLDLSRVMKMVLIHDIVEIDAGDTFLYDDNLLKNQKERETNAADRIFNLLPADQAESFRELWDEFEIRQTREAKFAAALDRFQPILHNVITKGKSWKHHGVKKEQVVRKCRHMKEGSAVFWEYALRLLESAEADGYFS